jgi:hypothetical protein
MKTFNEFVKDQHVLEEEGLRDFLKQHGLEDDWKAFKNKPKPIDVPREEPKGWDLSHDEAMRNINHIVKQCIDATPKVNKFGIHDIEFEIINKEQTVSGIKLDMEAKGTACARNDDHIKKQLEKLMAAAKKPLAERGIHMEVLYNKIDTSEAVEETNLDNPPIGLVRKYEFRVICVAMLNKKVHKQAAKNDE